MISPPPCSQAQEMGPRVTSAFTAVGIGWTCAVQLLANGRNQDVKCEDFHTTLHSERSELLMIDLCQRKAHMTWSEVTEGRPQVASEDARTQRMKHRELQSPGVGAL